MTTTPARHRRPLLRRPLQQQRAWNWYDWANSAYYTTIADGPVRAVHDPVAEQAACGFAGDEDRKCNVNLSVLGLSARPARWPSTSITLRHDRSAFVLPIVGALRGPRRAQEAC